MDRIGRADALYLARGGWKGGPATLNDTFQKGLPFQIKTNVKKQSESVSTSRSGELRLS